MLEQERNKTGQQRVRPIEAIKRKLAALDFVQPNFVQNDEAFHLIIEFGDTLNDWHRIVIAGEVVE